MRRHRDAYTVAPSEKIADRLRQILVTRTLDRPQLLNSMHLSAEPEASYTLYLFALLTLLIRIILMPAKRSSGLYHELKPRIEAQPSAVSHSEFHSPHLCVA